MKKTTILALSWRDITSPKAGGAEVHTHEMLSRADKKKYKIVHFATRSRGQAAHEEIDGVTYIRHGNAITVILSAMRYYNRHRDQIDFVIDQCNTHRFSPRKKLELLSWAWVLLFPSIREGWGIPITEAVCGDTMYCI